MRLVVRSSIVILLAVLARPAVGRDLYVNNQSGDDGATGHQPRVMPDRTGPVKTIVKALRLAQNGDRVVLAATGQPYRESVSFVGSRNGGTPSQRFVLQGSGAILDGSAPVPAYAWEHYRGAVFRFRPLNAEYQQLFFEDRPLTRVFASRFADAPPKLDPRQWCLHNGYIYFCVERDKLPQDYRLTCAQKQTGITLFHVECLTIVNLTVQGFQIDGISAFNSARLVTLEGVTCRGNGRSGVSVGGASLVDLDRCVIGNNGMAQLLTEPLSETHVRQSQLFSNTAPAWVDRGGKVSIDGKAVQGGLDERKTASGKSSAQPNHGPEGDRHIFRPETGQKMSQSPPHERLPSAQPNRDATADRPIPRPARNR